MNTSHNVENVECSVCKGTRIIPGSIPALDKPCDQCASAVEDVAPIHYGPIYGRRVGDTTALCKPPGTTSTMTNSWNAVTCAKCIGYRANAVRLSDGGDYEHCSR